MSSKFKIFGAVSVLAIGVGVGAYFLMGNSGLGIAAGKDATTLAVVNGKEITLGDVKELTETMPMAKSASLEQMYPIVIDQLVNDVLLGEKVDSSGIASDPVVQERVAIAKDQIVRGLYVERYVEDKVTDKAVKEEYAKLKKEAEGVQEAHAKHILLEKEDEAKEVIKKLAGGAKFEDLAKEYSIGPTGKNGGDLGFFTKDMMVPEFADATFDLKAGTYTKEPVKTKFGWHVVKLVEKRDRPVPKLEDIEQAIRGQLGQRAVDTLVRDLRENAEIKLFNLDGEPLEKAVN